MMRRSLILGLAVALSASCSGKQKTKAETPPSAQPPPALSGPWPMKAVLLNALATNGA